jgi:hypothetical protein
MRVTIQGDLSQIKSACRLLTQAIPERAASPRGIGRQRRKTVRHREELLTQRRLLRRAFDIIRRDPAQRDLVGNLARALGGSAPVTDALLDSAQQIIGAPQ